MLVRKERAFSNITTKPIQRTSSMWFFCILLYLFVDYGRPQDLLPIGFLRPGMLTILLLTWFLISNGRVIGEADSKQTRCILSFIGLLAVHIPFAKNNFLAYKTTKTMLLYLPFILSTIIVVDSLDRLKKIVGFIILTMVYVAIFCLTHAGKGSGNYFADENDLALYINTVLPFCYFLFMYEQKKLKKLGYGFALMLGVIGVVSSFSRGGFVGLLSMFVIVWLFSPKKVVSIIIIVLLAICIIYWGGRQDYEREISTITQTHEGTAKARIESWKAAWKMFLDNPMGVGGNNFQIRFPEYQTEYFRKEMWGRVAHSLWFTLLPELGVIGVFTYLLLLYYNLKDIFFLKKIKACSIKNRDHVYLHHLSLGFLASFTGYFVSGTFLSVLYYPHYWYLTAILVATKRIASRLSLDILVCRGVVEF